MSEADDRIKRARAKFERAARRMDSGVPLGDKAEDALWFAAPDLFAAVDERDALREEIMKIWFVLKEAGSHPGRTDDKLGECVRRVVDERNALRALLQRLEWSGTYSYCTGWPCCQICKGIKPGHGRDEHGDLPDASGHRNECALAKALERNR